jgi:hypothetical protein
LGHLVSSHFEFWVVSGQVGSGIRSSSIESFRVSGRIRSCIRSFQVSGHIRSGGSGIRSFSIESFHVSDRIRSNRVGYRIILSFELYRFRRV